MGGETKDLYRRFELEVRAPARRLPLDAFLPDPETLPSAVAAPAAPAIPEMSPEEARLFRPRDLDDEPPPPPKPKRKAKPAAKKKEGAMTLQEEIEEFMKRDRSAYAPDDDPEAGPGPASPAGSGTGAPAAGPATKPGSGDKKSG
jgi:hypothetical protein